MSASNKKRGAPDPERGSSTRQTKRWSYGPSAIVSTYYRTESTNWAHPPPRSAESPEAGPITSPLTEPPESSPILPTQDSEMTQSTLPETEWKLKLRFAAHLQERLSTTFTPTIKEAESLRKANRPLWSLRALAMDPESIIEGLNLQKMREWTAGGFDLQSFFDAEVMIPLVASLHLLRKGWYNENAEATKRSSEDIKAQTEVKEWYNNTCVLCGGQLVTQGAHIINVAAQKQREPLHVWRILRMFWPLEKLAALDIKEDRNILPLSPTAHALWDLHEFGLRPVKHSTDPDHILFLQVVIFKELHVGIGFSSNRPKGGFSIELADIREDPPKLIRHGDIYKLVTTDPEQRPLPRFHYLQLRYAVQTIIAAQKAHGAIRTLFGGPPPDSTIGPELEDVRVPRQWQEDLDEAKRLGVLDSTSQSKWERAILESEYRKAHAWSEDEDIENESTEEENVPWGGW
ncbi:hypothetical protein QBC39DRAFT_362085 [Podospora conica]|nr:hypothetical protein QBC39DRAFT_362085 [Schizothecium conicum]